MTARPESQEDLRDLYKELILDHARNPRHFGELDAATHSADGVNLLCGDKLHLYVEVRDETIQSIRFNGTGCAISVASASLLTETVIGMKAREALSFSERLVARLKGTNPERSDEVELGKLRALEGVREFPSRVKCATLAWHTLESAINRNEAPASTE